MDIQKHIAHWRAGSEEDFEVARELVGNGRLHHGLFFLHLAVEKMLKAHVVKETQEVPPKIHNLLTLSNRTGLNVTDEVLQFFSRLNAYQLVGRYPDSGGSTALSREHAEDLIDVAQETLEWLKAQL
ncbi:MAG: HEPN domain-containing protein [Candidatus Hydrogenedentota bacterium]